MTSMNGACFSAKKQDWGTPQDLFYELDKEFGFTLDLCATAENAKCARYYTPEQNGLEKPWTGVCWCNPPYGRGVAAWIEKAYYSEALVVMLLPARTDTKWFHDFIWDRDTNARRFGVEVRFLKGRLTFEGAPDTAPFPSMIVVFS